jgi:hypothetical protein
VYGVAATTPWPLGQEIGVRIRERSVVRFVIAAVAILFVGLGIGGTKATKPL